MGYDKVLPQPRGHTLHLDAWGDFKTDKQEPVESLISSQLPGQEALPVGAFDPKKRCVGNMPDYMNKFLCQ